MNQVIVRIVWIVDRICPSTNLSWCLCVIEISPVVLQEDFSCIGVGGIFHGVLRRKDFVRRAVFWLPLSIRVQLHVVFPFGLHVDVSASVLVVRISVHGEVPDDETLAQIAIIEFVIFTTKIPSEFGN